MTAPASSADSRAKPVRITVDLAPADYQALNRWLAKAAVELDQPFSRMTQARALRAMIRATAADDVVNDVVLDLLRREHEREAEPDDFVQDRHADLDPNADEAEL